MLLEENDDTERIEEKPSIDGEDDNQNVIGKEDDTLNEEIEESEGISNDNQDDEDSGDEEEDNDEEGGNDDDGDEDNDDDNNEDEEDEDDIEAPSSREIGAMIASNFDDENEVCSFDLKNLVAMNTHQVSTAKLFAPNNNDESIKYTIEPTPSNKHIQKPPPPLANEDYLMQLATHGCTQLIAALWQLPTQKSDAGPMATLPAHSEIPLPRQMPPPPPKQETRWEKFAKERGIPLNKQKRSQKVWDEATQSWMFRHGYKRANQNDDWPIMEVGANDDPYENPWHKLRDAKRRRVEQNVKNRVQNQERAGILPKGTARRIASSKIPEGISQQSRGRENTRRALVAAQQSTASMGQFDGLRDGEESPKTGSRHRSSLVARMRKKRDLASSSTEEERSKRVLKNVLQGGGKAKELAIRRGEYSKGETALDYEYSDGLGPSTFNKKKGRGGTGKMKKMTKKRIQ